MSNSNNKFFKILVAIDGSEESIKASKYVIDNITFNQRADLQFIAVTVIELTKLNISTFIAAPTYGLEDLEKKKETSSRVAKQY